MCIRDRSYKWKHHDQDVLNHLCEGKVKFLDMSWNVIMNWKSNFSSRMDILKLSPRNIYNEYLASRAMPKIIHYAGYQKPWKDPSCDYAEDFWIYARRTYFYEKMCIRDSYYSICNRLYYFFGQYEYYFFKKGCVVIK